MVQIDDTLKSYGQKRKYVVTDIVDTLKSYVYAHKRKYAVSDIVDTLRDVLASMPQSVDHWLAKFAKCGASLDLAGARS